MASLQESTMTDVPHRADSLSEPQGSERPFEGSSRVSGSFTQILASERNFLILVMLGMFAAGASTGSPGVAMWVGFLFASYAAVANDSIQTIGTFIASNRNKPWWAMWLFIGGIFLATVWYSWMTHGGDVSYERLQAKGFEEAPQEFAFLQVAAPLFLIILTRMRMPVSTTFLLLSSFATQSSGITSMLSKSLTGYFLAFGLAVALWYPLGRYMARTFTGEAHPAWRVFQWATSGLLWSVWIQQDAANIAVYLPRSMNAMEFAAFAGTIFVGLGILFKMGGERIQRVVDEKSNVVDVRAATVIDLLYAVILFVFKLWSKVPMSTTWVFLGLLAGRELSLAARGASEDGRTFREAGRLVFRDASFAVIGLLVSLLIACTTNSAVREGMIEDVCALLGI